MKDAKTMVTDAIRTEFDRASDDARTEIDRRRDAARERFDEGTDVARQEVGKRLFDIFGEYFPEEARRRRRKVAAVAFGAGVAVGVVSRRLLSRR